METETWKDIVYTNLEALEYRYQRCELERDLWLKKPVHTALFLDINHFLFTRINKNEAKTRFAACWPATDGTLQRDFRMVISDWLTEMKAQPEATRFVSEFVPRILLHPGRAVCVQFYACFSTYVLQCCLDRTSFKRKFRPARKNRMMDYATSATRASDATLQEKIQSVKQDEDQLMRELQKRERSARSKLSILRGLSHSKPPSDVHQIEQKAEVFTKQLEDVTSLLTTWDELTSLLSGLAQTSRKDRTFDGAKFQRGEPLDVVSLLQKYAEDLSAFADKVEGADFAPFADAIPVLELQLQLHKDTTDQLQTARAKLETMEANCKATIAECEKVLESRDLRPLPEIVINGHVCNFDPFPAILKPRPLASASNGDSDNSLDLTNTAANVTVIENVLIPTTTGTPGMDKVVTASSDSLLFRNGKDCDVLTPPVLQDLYDSKESLPSDMDGDNL
ncbi:uncharacterized protein LOC135396697 isoform X2 [Ornithodoros turicata]|uniref:uncharacterized protein LOC135396697 isoform X2 n=1 Tax=Ornithodoros turicata TaxID=34597 RepID=UPI0031391E37